LPKTHRGVGDSDSTAPRQAQAAARCAVQEAVESAPREARAAATWRLEAATAGAVSAEPGAS
jgi:hypothetical protein